MRKFLILLAVALMATPAAFAASRSHVVVLFNGNTEVNRESINFLRRQFASSNLPYDLSFTQNAGAVQPGQQRAVVVFNTGGTGSVDPKWRSFIDAFPDKKEVILVTLVSGTDRIFVDSISAGDSALGVDGVTSATTWPHGFFGGNQRQALLSMHGEWVGKVADLIGRI